MNRVTNCIINRDSSYMPIWFMRQAGRYLPEFRKIREINPNFVKLCLTPNLVSEITLQPINRFDIDAAIIFSDILMIPYGLGQDLKFEKGLGPKLGNLNIDNIIEKKNDYFLNKVLPVYEGIKRVKEKIKNKDLIGFVGAPWTILVYMLNRESPKKNFDLKKILREKTKIKNLLAKIVEIICLHADKQIELTKLTRSSEE